MLLILASVVVMAWTPAWALTVNVDLGGATTGTFIDGGGADFAQNFVGQTVSGVGITGNPSDPLTLDGSSGTLLVQFWDTSNSILPQPGNAAPLSVLLESLASSVTRRMRYGDPPSSVDIDFFDATGALVHSVNQAILNGYNDYTFSGFGLIAGFTIYNNYDEGGLRYQNFSYETTGGDAAPIPGAAWLLGSGLTGLLGLKRKFLALPAKSPDTRRGPGEPRAISFEH